jgi:hypothetical protein
VVAVRSLLALAAARSGHRRIGVFRGKAATPRKLDTIPARESLTGAQWQREHESEHYMSDPGSSLIPITDEQAKALQEALKTLQGIGGFLKQTFGTVPEDLVGLLGGDWLKARRLENFARIAQKAQERLKARHVDAPEPPRLSILLPLINAAADEEDDELQDMWARLFAAAADPSRAKSFRLAFIDTVKRMDPLDARVLQQIADGLRARQGSDLIGSLTESLKVSRDEAFFALEHLHELGCLETSPMGDPAPRVSAKGRLLMQAVSD